MAHITILANRLLVEKAASLLTFFGLETAVFATDKPALFRGEIEIADLDFDTRLNKVGRQVAIGTGAVKKTTGEKAVIYQLPVRR